MRSTGLSIMGSSLHSSLFAGSVIPLLVTREPPTIHGTFSHPMIIVGAYAVHRIRGKF